MPYVLTQFLFCPVFSHCLFCIQTVSNAGKTSKTVEKMLERQFVIVQVYDKMS